MNPKTMKRTKSDNQSFFTTGMYMLDQIDDGGTSIGGTRRGRLDKRGLGGGMKPDPTLIAA